MGPRRLAQGFEGDDVNDELDEKQAEAVKLLKEMTSLGSPEEVEEQEAIENLLKM